MGDSWEGLLDLIELSEHVRLRSNLNVLMEFPLGDPTEPLLLELYESIKRLYGPDNFFSIVWFKRSKNDPDISYLAKKIVGKDETKIIQYLWLSFSGEYIVFLPRTFDINTIGSGDEEELIGKLLIKNGQLLLKTPDANEILYLYLN